MKDVEILARYGPHPILPALPVLMLFSAVSLVAQTTLGTIRGLVTDPTGATVAGVSVMVRNRDTNIENRTTTGNVTTIRTLNGQAGPRSGQVAMRIEF